MRCLFEKLAKRKNPDFKLDETITNGLIFRFFMLKAIERGRALKLLMRGKRSDGLFLGKGVRFFHLKNIRFGKMVRLEDYVYLSALGSGPIELGDHVRIGAFSRLVISTSFDNPGAFIKIGKNVGIGEFAYLGGAGGLEIGEDCIIGQYLSCHPENHKFGNQDRLIRKQGVSRKGIKIGKNCWIGAKVTVLDGVSIGDGCVVAAGAVVTKSMPPRTVIGGVPAKIIRRIDRPEEALMSTFSE